MDADWRKPESSEAENRAFLPRVGRDPRHKMRSPIIPLILIIALIAVASILGLLAYQYRHFVYGWGEILLQADKEQVRIWLESWGPLAPLVFILVQALQLVVAPIPGEVTGFLAGFLFGVPGGFVYATLGIVLGSTLFFLIGRWLEVLLIEKWIRQETLEKFNFLIEREGALGAFILFLIPGAPKDYLCFILGLSRMPLKMFLLLMTVGRMPATFLLTLQGAQVYQGNYLVSVWLMILPVSAAGMLLMYRKKFYRWLRNLSDTSRE